MRELYIYTTNMYWFVWDNMDCHRFTIYPDCKPFGWGATNWVDMSMKGRFDMLLAMFRLEALVFLIEMIAFIFYGLSDALLCSNSNLSSLGPSGHQPCIDSPYRRCFRQKICNGGGGPPADCQRVHLQVYLQYDATQLFCSSFITFYNPIIPHLTCNHTQKNIKITQL